MKNLLIIFVLILWTETLADQSPDPGPEYADVVFLVDGSDHLGIKSFPFVKTFISKMINSLPIEANKFRVALAQYSDSLHSEFQLNTFKSRNPMLNHLKKNFAFMGGSLRIGNALQEAHKAYFSKPANGRDKKLFPPILVVLASAESEDDVEVASKALQREGVRIISVGLQTASEENLKAMATAQFHFRLRTVRDLSAFSQNMTQIIKDAIQYKEGAVHNDIKVPSPVTCEKDSLADLVFLVDEAVGTRQNLRNLQRFLENITTSLDVKANCIRLGLVSYSNEAEIVSFLKSSTSQSAFQEQIQKLSLRAGRSNAGAAIEKLRREAFLESSGSRKAQGVPQIMVLVTHRPSDDEVRDAAMKLRMEGVTVLAVGIQRANKTQLEEIVSYPPTETVSMLQSYADLETYSRNFLKKVHNEIWSQIDVRAEHADIDKTGCVDTKEADFYFLIDGSGSIRMQDFDEIKKFMLGVIDMFSIGPDKVRVGAVQYSREKQVEFDIHVYTNYANLRQAVLNIKQLGGGTTTGAALDFILPIIREGRKQRSGEVPCHLIVLTDGMSEDSVVEPAETIRAEQITIHAVGIGQANKAQLLEIAGKEERVKFGHNFDFLERIKNEVVQSICTEKGCEGMKTDIMFLVDSSYSIGATNFQKMKAFMKNVTTKIQIGPDKTQIGVVQFSDHPQEEFQLDRYFTQKEISAAIDRMSAIEKNTLTGKALAFVEEYFTDRKGARSGVKQFLILITDGEAQDDVRDPAKALRDRGVTIISVGVYGSNRTQLEEISGDGSLVFHVENFDHLETIQSKISFYMCALYDCKHIKQLDVVFVLDHSSSITEQQQKSMINLTVHLVNKADIGRDLVQFGAVKYSDQPEVLFYLNTYSTRSAIVENLRRHRSTGGDTYTAKALNHTGILFTEKYGSRIKQGVRQMLIIITDGDSQDRQMLNGTALKLREKGIIIYAVGVDKASQTELELMAGNKNNTIHVSDFDKLQDIYLLLQENMCINAQQGCNNKEADVIFLCDSSDMVSDSDFVTLTNFLSDLIDNFNIESQRIKIGMAQFGSLYSEIIGLGNSLNKTQWKTQIQSITKNKGPPQISFALEKVKLMFHPSAGGRKNAGVPQTLVVITSGDPQDDVADAVKKLKNLGICVMALGIGHVHKAQLLRLTGDPEKITTVQDFNKLKNVEVKKRIVREICEGHGKTDCFVNIVVGFDISTHQPGQLLFHGHPRLESYLPGILQDITSIRGVSCGGDSETYVNVAFKVDNDRDFLANFQIYQETVFQRLLQVTVNGPTHLNAQFLKQLWDTFQTPSASQGQVLLIFSDGLGSESITTLANQSDRLREVGLDALLVVSLNPTADDDFSSFEFGKGFDYRTHLTIGKRDLGKTLSQYLGNIAERKCCCTFCKCPGTPGPHGTQGLQGPKGSRGLKGTRGHRGDDGDPGTRGETGPPGDKGITGCPGQPGQKGARGLPGYKGEKGEDGIDGLDGEEGFHGFPGEKGEKGDPGSEGSPGSRGPPGEHGAKGFPGDPGDPGQNNNIQGPKGSKGEQGRQGRTGLKGIQGTPNSRGNRGREGQRGHYGAPGEPGDPGPTGTQGAEGLQGPQGLNGIPGRKGAEGSQGHKGPQGPPGLMGPKGSVGRPGPLGKKGEPGFPGESGPVGPPGQRGEQGDYGIPGYGLMGQKGIKGPRGLLGVVGEKGEIGNSGTPGPPGLKGFRGRSTSGSQGAEGSRGPPGPPGRRGPKGKVGTPIYSQCDLIQFMRDHSPCWKEKCPLYPTELVFALDQSYGITDQRFNEMRNAITSIVNDLNIRENNCPVGARVAVVSYDSYTSYLIRWSDYHSKKQLLQLLSQIKHQSPTAPQDIGNAMRFVARNIFKRTSAGANVRRVAVFFSNGQVSSRSSLIAATMELSALDISPTVFVFNERGFLDDAFGFDSTGTFQVIPAPSDGQHESSDRLWRCTLCYDKCSPNACIKEILLPADSHMDVAVLLHNSYNIASDEFKAMKDLVSAMLDNFNIASDPSIPDSGDRIALLSYSPWDSSRRRTGAVKSEFKFTTYNSQVLMKSYIQNSLRQLNGEATIGHALLWTIQNLFPEAPHLRKHKVIFVVSAGENYERRELLKKVALRAKCRGYVIFVISLGSPHKDNLEELASYPLDHHLIQLGRIHKPDLDYIVKFLKPFVYAVRRGFNEYPPSVLENACRLNNLQEEDSQNSVSLVTAESRESFLDEDSYIDQELSAEAELSFMLDGSENDHVGHIPSQMLMHSKSMITYEKGQDSEKTANLASDIWESRHS